MRLGDQMAAGDLAAAVDELAWTAAQRSFVRGETAMVSAPAGSVLVDCVAHDGAVDLLLTARPRGRTGALLWGTQVLVVPDAGPARHGRIGPTGQLRVRGLASAGFRLRLRRAVWLDDEALPLHDDLAADLGIVVVRGSWPGPAPWRARTEMAAQLDADAGATAFQSADGALLVEMHRGAPGRSGPPGWAVQARGPEGDARLDGRVVRLRLGFGPGPAREVPLRLAWDGQRCWGHLPLGPADVGTMTLGVPDTAAVAGPTASTSAGAIRPAEASVLVALAADAGQDREARLGALELLGAGIGPGSDVRPLLATLAEADSELRTGVLAVLGAAQASWSAAAVAGQLASDDAPIEVKEAAAAALGRIPGMASRTALHRALRDPDGRARLLAARALGAAGG